jgi:hypothetical protein
MPDQMSVGQVPGGEGSSSGSVITSFTSKVACSTTLFLFLCWYRHSFWLGFRINISLRDIIMTYSRRYYNSSCNLFVPHSRPNEREKTRLDRTDENVRLPGSPYCVMGWIQNLYSDILYMLRALSRHVPRCDNEMVNS